MTGITGRRGGTAKRIGKGFLEGLSALGTALADGPKISRINEIDEQIKELLQERDHLVVGLTQDYEGYEVSENYDPKWRKTVVEDEDDEPDFVIHHTSTSDGRLTQCRGRSTSSTYHSAHPGCPYVDKIHNAHEFTLRD